MGDEVIIIKKIKKGGHGHHGGAWKVAYADFVTAMMAFFLLLWLLTSTPVENLQGLADYFSPTIGLQGKMGIGFSGGQSPNTEGVSLGDWASQGLIFGAPPSGPIIKFPETDNNSTDQYEPVSFSRMGEEITKAIKGTLESTPFNDSVLIDITPEGLRVQITDKDKRTMFEDGSAVLLPHAKDILTKIAAVVAVIPHYLKIEGHTSSSPFKGMKNDYSHWELSADRANTTRRFLESLNVDPEQIGRVVAKADHDLLNRNDAEDVINNRITVILLKNSFIAMHKQPAPEEILLGEKEALGLDAYIKATQQNEPGKEKESSDEESEAKSQ